MIQNDMVSPYGAAHNATANPDNGYLRQEMVDFIATLAMAMASDSAAIVQLTSTVARLKTELVTVNNNLVISLQEKSVICSSRGGRDRDACVFGAGAGDGAGYAARTRAGAPSLAETVIGVDLDPPIH